MMTKKTMQVELTAPSSGIDSTPEQRGNDAGDTSQTSINTPSNTPINTTTNTSKTSSPAVMESPPASASGSLMAGFDTELGHYHDTNEDFAGYNGYFFGVADGVGGGACGDLAAQTMIDSCKQSDWQSKRENPSQQDKDNKAQIHSILTTAQDKVTQAIEQQTDKRGGCAFAGVWLDSTTGQGYYSWVGDVRIYHIYPDSRAERQQDGLLVKCLTIDQTYENLNETSPSGKQDSLARLVGFDTMGEPEIQQTQLNIGEYLLIVCDGIHNFISHQQLQAECQQLLPTEQLATEGVQSEPLDNELSTEPSQAELPKTEQPQTADKLTAFCTHLITLAKENHSHDDCTALLVSREQSEPKQATNQKNRQENNPKNNPKNRQDNHSDSKQTTVSTMPIAQVAHITAKWGRIDNPDNTDKQPQPTKWYKNNDSNTKDPTTYPVTTIKLLLLIVLYILFGILVGISGAVDVLHNVFTVLSVIRF